MGAAAYVYVYRDPRATIFSIMRRDWGFPNLRAAVNFWKRRYEEDVAGLAFLEKHCPEKLFFVKYEELCESPNKALNTIKEKLNFSYNNGGQSFVFVPNYTESQHKRLLSSPKEDESWREYFSQNEIEYIKGYTQHSFFASYYFASQVGGCGALRLGAKDRVRALRKPFDRIRGLRRRLRRGFQVRTV